MRDSGVNWILERWRAWTGNREPRGEGNDRSGSHMLVVGKEHNYSSFGGIVVGQRHTTSGEYASVSGGFSNVASGDTASVSGGFFNQASGLRASVSGGSDNQAIGGASSVSGGFQRVVSVAFNWRGGLFFSNN